MAAILHLRSSILERQFSILDCPFSSLPRLQLLQRLTREREIADLVDWTFFFGQTIPLKLDLNIGHLTVLGESFELDVVRSCGALRRLRHRADHDTNRFFAIVFDEPLGL